MIGLGSGRYCAGHAVQSGDYPRKAWSATIVMPEKLHPNNMEEFMTPSMEMMYRIQQGIASVQHELNRLDDWTEAECRDSRLGMDLDAVNMHLDLAVGRCSMCMFQLRRINATTQTIPSTATLPPWSLDGRRFPG